MTRQELIKAAKENLARYFGMDEEMKLFFKTIYKGDFIALSSYGKWYKWNSGTELCKDTIYRLRPDYEEPDEPELIECEIDWDNGRYEVNGDLFPIHEIAPFSKDGYGAGYRIAGYKYEESDNLHDVVFFNIHKDPPHSEDEEITKTIYATHIIFKKVKS